MTGAPEYLHQVPAIRKGLETLLRDDPVFSAHTIYIDHFTWTYVGPGFDGLVRIVIGQQVSTAAARSIWQRVCAAIDPAPETIFKTPEQDLRALGLSAAKVRAIRGLAESVAQGDFVPGDMDRLDNHAVAAAITAMKGFGPWSAQMYLMFGLARPDVWAPGDLGIRTGLQYYLGRDVRPDIDETAAAESRFSPHQTAASLLLWQIKNQQSA